MNTDPPVWRTLPEADMEQGSLRSDRGSPLQPRMGGQGGFLGQGQGPCWRSAKSEAHIVGLCYDRVLCRDDVNFEEPETIPECSLE